MGEGGRTWGWGVGIKWGERDKLRKLGWKMVGGSSLLERAREGKEGTQKEERWHRVQSATQGHRADKQARLGLI